MPDGSRWQASPAEGDRLTRRHPDPRPVPRDAGDVADLRLVVADRGHVVRREHLAQHGDALHQREPGTDATPYAAAERDPGVGGRVLPEEAVGVEGPRVV